MKNDENKGVEVFAPLLRGIYHSLGCSVLVRQMHENPTELSIDLPEGLRELSPHASIPVSRELLELIAKLKESIQHYYRNKGSLPGTIAIAGGLYSIENITETTQDKGQGNAYNVNLSGRIALVSGAAQGIGLGIAKGLVHAGMMVFFADINKERTTQVVEKINKEYGRLCAKAMQIDVSSQASVEEAAQSLCRETGGLDVLISNAGVSKPGSLESLSHDDFTRMMRINYAGFYYMVKSFSPYMKFQNLANKRYTSDIIQINSKSGLRGSKKNFAYASSKFAGIGLCQSFALELAPFCIKVNAVCPGNFLSGPLWTDPEKGLLTQFLKEGKVPNAKTTDDVLRYYLSHSPLGAVLNRGCSIEDITQAVLYAIIQQYETGQAIPVTGGQEFLS